VLSTFLSSVPRKQTKQRWGKCRSKDTHRGERRAEREESGERAGRLSMDIDISVDVEDINLCPHDLDSREAYDVCCSTDQLHSTGGFQSLFQARELWKDPGCLVFTRPENCAINRGL
jgi:hypothetical protein